MLFPPFTHPRMDTRVHKFVHFSLATYKQHFHVPPDLSINGLFRDVMKSSYHRVGAEKETMHTHKQYLTALVQ